MPFSLAPWRYRAVMKESGGPIEHLSVREGTLLDGTRCFDAAAILDGAIRTPHAPPLALYSDQDGSGTARTRAVAGYTAISEALERWAFNQICSSPDASRYGFDVDDSSTGMAAFPGLTEGAARPASRREAIERWAVLEWWRGTLAAERHMPSHPAIEGLRIRTPFDDTTVLLLWSQSPLKGGVVYGFAAGPDAGRCEFRAVVELSRNAAVLDHFSGGEVRDNGERRLIFFALPEGHARFQERVEESLRRRSGTPRTPRTLVDAAVPGPWSDYSGVWRVLLEHVSGPDADTQPDVFLF